MIMVVLGMLFMLSNHAMMSIMCIIGIVLFYFYMSFVMCGGVWFGLVMVLVMLSGVLVIFTYMASLVPNDKFELMQVGYGFIFILCLMVGFDLMMLYGYDVSFLCLKLWDVDFMIYLMFGLSFLLLIMLFIIDIVGSFMGALRVE
uniref:NADH dehydrogenase subunit 6 n=1 Tax=Parachtes limbarae TaxID=1110490 RepID=A0A516IME3_9ARAC|nr:NADH dehydrogenase subunit 6 [Parachtes limbarae]